MGTTGAPYNIPYLESSTLLRDIPDADEAQADAVAAALAGLQTEVDSAGGLVAVKSAIFTGVQAASVAAGGNVAVTDLTITHEVADPANRLIISAFLGHTTNGTPNGTGNAGIAIHDGTGLIGVGDADGTRTRIAAGGASGSQEVNFGVGNVGQNLSLTFVHTPGAGSKTYTVRAASLAASGTQTVVINRAFSDGNSPSLWKAASSLVIQEVRP